MAKHADLRSWKIIDRLIKINDLRPHFDNMDFFNKIPVSTHKNQILTASERIVMDRKDKLKKPEIVKFIWVFRWKIKIIYDSEDWKLNKSRKLKAWKAIEMPSNVKKVSASRDSEIFTISKRNLWKMASEIPMLMSLLQRSK